MPWTSTPASSVASGVVVQPAAIIAQRWSEMSDEGQSVISAPPTAPPNAMPCPQTATPVNEFIDSALMVEPVSQPPSAQTAHPFPMPQPQQQADLLPLFAAPTHAGYPQPSNPSLPGSSSLPHSLLPAGTQQATPSASQTATQQTDCHPAGTQQASSWPPALSPFDILMDGT